MSGPRAAPRRQRGVVTLLLSLIMLLLISVMLTCFSSLCPGSSAVPGRSCTCHTDCRLVSTSRSATPAVAESVSSVTLAGISTPFAWQTIWELDASVTETGSGASIRVRQGVRVLLTQARKDAVCA